MKAYEQIAKDINEAIDSAWEAGHRVALEEVEAIYNTTTTKGFICWLERKFERLERERNGNK